MTISAAYAHARGLTAPGPRGSILLGKLEDLWREGMHSVLRDAWIRYGDLASIRFGSKIIYLVVHPEHVHHILVNHRENYTKQSHRARPLIGDALTASNGDLWKRQRALLQPRFQMRLMPQFAANIQDAIARVVERWTRYADRREPINISDEMAYLTLDTIVRSMTGQRVFDDGSELREAIRVAVECVAASGQVFRIPFGVPAPTNLRFKRAVSIIDDFVARAVKAQRRQPAEATLLAFLLNTQDETNRGMSEQLIRDEAVNLLIAGHDSTAQALCWIWYLLDTHRSVRARVYGEIDSSFSGRTPTANDRDKLPWLGAVVQEVLRQYPPFWVFPRHATHDDQLKGYLVPAGATMMLCPYFTHRLVEFWEEPDRFMPERFLDGDGAAQSRLHRASYYPFGYGPRTCIGNHLATMEIQLAVATLAQKFELTHPSSMPPVEPEFSTTLRPKGGLWMHVRRRAPPAQPPVSSAT